MQVLDAVYFHWNIIKKFPAFFAYAVSGVSERELISNTITVCNFFNGKLFSPSILQSFPDSFCNLDFYGWSQHKILKKLVTVQKSLSHFYLKRNLKKSLIVTLATFRKLRSIKATLIYWFSSSFDIQFSMWTLIETGTPNELHI